MKASRNPLAFGEDGVLLRQVVDLRDEEDMRR